MNNTEAIMRFERYLKRRSPGRSTAKHYISDVRLFQASCDKPWQEVTRHDLDAFVDKGAEAGWKPATIRRRVAALKAFFEFCAEETGQLEVPNPVVFARHAPKLGQHLPQDVADDTVRRLWAVIESPRDRAIFALMLRAGLRVGEVVALRPMDILAPATRERPGRLRVRGEGDKERVVYLSADAYALLDEYRQEDGALEEPLFRNWRGQGLTVAGVQACLRKYCEQAGVHVTCHQLRHTFARQLAEEEMSLLNLSKLLGHTNLSTTQLYIDGADPELSRAYSEAMARWEDRDQSSAPVVEDKPRAPEPEDEPEPAAEAPTPPPGLYEAMDWAPDLPTWVREACLSYVRQRQRDWKPSQREHHARHMLNALARFWRWQLDQRTLHGWGDLTRDDLQAYIDQRLADGRAASTVKNEIYPLWGVMRRVIDQGTALPPALFRLRLPKAGEALPRPLSAPEAQRLEGYVREHWLGQADPQARRDAAWFFVLLHTGLRLSELLDLQGADLDLAGARLRIREGKGRRDRVVYLSPTALRALQDYLAQAPRQPEDPLFQRAGQSLQPHWVRQQVRTLGKAAGVEGVTPHRLRHTFATRLASLDVPVQRIQKLMGHRNLTTTQRYIRVSDKAVEQDYQRAMAQIERGEVPLSMRAIPLSEWLPVGSIIRVTIEIPNSV